MKAWGFGGFCDLAALQRLFQAGSQGSSNQWNHRHVVLPACAVGVAAAVAVHHHTRKQISAGIAPPLGPGLLSGLPFASISSASLAPPADGAAVAEDLDTEPATGIKFQKTINLRKPCCKGADKFVNLTGLGVRLKNLFGLANIRVYAFGVYIDPVEVKAQLEKKYTGLPSKANLLEDLTSADVPVVVRLIISYKKLKVGQMRKAFSESVGSSLESLSGKPEPELLQTFVSWFSDDLKLQRGTVIDLKRGKGHVVTAEFDGKFAGSVKSELLGKALLNLYIGGKPFDKKAKEAVQEGCAKLL